MLDLNFYQMYLRQLYSFSSIPAFLYSKEEQLLCNYPNVDRFAAPGITILQQLLELPDKFGFIRNHHDVFWGIIHLPQAEGFLVLGPVLEITLHPATRQKLIRDLLITSEEMANFDAFTSQIPIMLQPEFTALLRFLHLNLYAGEADEWRVEDSDPDANADSRTADEMLAIYQEHQDGYYNESEEETLYNNRQVEDELCSIIEDGNLERLKNFSKRANRAARYGNISKDPIRQLKTTAIIATTIVSRAAIRGGLSPVFAFLTGDLYMRKVEELYTPEKIYQLIKNMQYDFCKRVNDSKKVQNMDNEIMQALDFVHANLNKKIQVGDVANAVGLSRSYLSRRFKQELGFSLNSFIRRCKLEEAKSLLRYSDKSISHISEYLCFSSQSNFQNVFKEQYGITPAQYRKQQKR